MNNGNINLLRTKSEYFCYPVFPEFRISICVLFVSFQKFAPLSYSGKSKAWMKKGMEQWWNDTDRGKPT